MNKILKTKYHQEWNARWKNETTCRQTRLMLPDLNPQLSHFMFQLSRTNLSLISQFLTGHNYLRYHRSVSGQFLLRPKCHLCSNAVEDSWHLLIDCEALERLRRQAFDHMVPPFLQPNQLLWFIRNSKIVKLMDPDEDM